MRAESPTCSTTLSTPVVMRRWYCSPASRTAPMMFFTRWPVLAEVNTYCAQDIERSCER